MASLSAVDERVVTGTGPGVLAEAVGVGTALTIWDRALPEALQGSLPSHSLDDVDDVLADLSASAPDARAILSAAGYPPATATPLADDIGHLATLFAPIVGTDRLVMRLEVLDTDACRRFHADYTRYRLICTYVGPGTQWCLAAGNAPVRDVPTGAVAIFKGRRLLDEPPVLHRSPPIAASGGRRLVLVLDAATD